MIDWSDYHNFSKTEFDCKHTGLNLMQPVFMNKLQKLRDIYNRSMIISSGYRDITHPVERAKSQPGVHSFGVAADILVSGQDAVDLIGLAYQVGFRRIGVKQNGSHRNRFIHLDVADLWYEHAKFTQTVWSY